MQSRSVVLGKYNRNNFRITAQDSKKKHRRKEIVFKHGRSHKWDINEISAMKKAFRFSAKRTVDHVGYTELSQAVTLFNSVYGKDFDPNSLKVSWDFI